MSVLECWFQWGSSTGGYWVHRCRLMADHAGPHECCCHDTYEEER